MIFDGVPKLVKGAMGEDLGFLNGPTPSSAYLSSRLQHALRLFAVAGDRHALLHLLGAFLRVSGGWSQATWQTRSKGSNSLPGLDGQFSASAQNTPSLASPSMTALLFSGIVPAPQKSSRSWNSLASALRV